MKVSTKLLSFIIGLGFICMLLIAVILYDLNRSIFISDVLANQNLIVAQSGSEISQYIGEYRLMLELVADLAGMLKMDDWTREVLIRVVGRQIENFRDLSLVGPDGKEIVAALPRMIPRSFSNDEVVQRALQGERAYSRVHFDKLNAPTIFMATPIKRRGKVVGAVWAHFELKRVWEVLERIKPNERSSAYLFDKDGRQLPQRNIIFTRSAILPGKLDLAHRNFQGETSTWKETYRGEKFMITALKIPETNWTLVLPRSLSDIYHFFYKDLILSAIVISVISLIGCFLTIFFVRRFLLPIKNLRDGVAQLAAGTLSHRVKVETRDEIGDLCVSFNCMAEELQRYMKRVVRRVEEDVHQKNLSMLGVTAGQVSHQVKNSLNVMSFALSNLKMSGITEDNRNTVEVMERNIQNLRGFMESQLAFTRKPRMKFMEYDLGEELNQLVQSYEPRGLRVSVAYVPSKESDFKVQCDWRQLSQAFSCILDNSLDAQNGEGRVKIEMISAPEKVTMKFCDFGPGLRPEIIDHVFEPFYTTKEDQGVGLGLALARNIIEAHSGAISAENTQEGGACFIVELPKRVLADVIDTEGGGL
jgi:signal transduction histidine kinase